MQHDHNGSVFNIHSALLSEKWEKVFLLNKSEQLAKHSLFCWQKPTTEKKTATNTQSQRQSSIYEYLIYVKLDANVMMLLKLNADWVFN